MDYAPETMGHMMKSGYLEIKLRKIHPLLKIAALLLCGLILAASLLLARLWMGPMSVGFLTPYLKSALLFDRQDLSLQFDDAVLTLEGMDSASHSLPAVKIRLTHVRVSDGAGKEMLTIPSGAIGLSVAGLMQGVIAPSSIEIDGPTVYVSWRGGDIFADFGANSDPDNMLEEIPASLEQASVEILPFFIRELASPADKHKAAGYLRRIRIVNANLVLRELDTQSLWTVPGARLELARSENGVQLNAHGLLEKSGTKSAGFDLAGNYDPRHRQTALKITFRGLNPAEVAGDSQSMTVFRAVNMPLYGALYVNLAEGRRIISAGFDIDSGAGILDLPKYYPAPLHFDQIRAKGKYDRRLKQFSIDTFSLQFGRTRFDGVGLLYAGHPGPGVHLSGDIKNLPLLALKDYWPEKLATGGYEWVTENITAGMATSGHLDLNITPNMRLAKTLPAEALDFRFNFEGVEAHYLRPMPPIKEGRGYAKLDLRNFDLTVEEATVAGVKMARSQLHFGDLDNPDKTFATVVADFTGALPKALALIDHEPLGYPSQYGLKPDSVLGNSAIHLTLAFPLKRSIRLKDVDFDVLADLKNLAIPELFDTVGLDQGHLKMHVNRKGIHTTGMIALNTVPFDFTWNEDFADNIEYSSKYSLKAPLADGEWAALHLPVGPYLKGPALLNVKLQGKGARIMAGKGSLDLSGSEISTGRLGFVKPAGDKALMTFALERRGEGLDVREIAYRDARVEAGGSLSLGPENEIIEAALKHFTYGGTALSASLKPGEAGGYDISLNAGQLDARPLIKELTRRGDDENEMDLPDFKLSARIAHVTAEGGVTARQIKILANYRNNLWTDIRADGKFTNAENFTFDISPAGQGADKANRKLSLIADDAGALGRAFGLFHNVMGGALDVKGDLTGTGKGQTLAGAVAAKNFKIVKSPVLGDILNKGASAKANARLKADEISFEALDLPYVFHNGAIVVKPSRAYGPYMGITMEGGIDLRYDSLTLNGTIVPAYTLNSMLRLMPVVGDLLMGGKGKGLFALTYKVTGPVAAPRVDVNPLAVLAPGFLRGIVEAFEGAGETVSPERKAAEKKAAALQAKAKAEKAKAEKAARLKAMKLSNAQAGNN